MANILIDETEKPLPLEWQLASLPEHVQCTVVFREVEKVTEAPVTLWLESPLTVISTA